MKLRSIFIAVILTLCSLGWGTFARVGGTSSASQTVNPTGNKTATITYSPSVGDQVVLAAFSTGSNTVSTVVSSNSTISWAVEKTNATSGGSIECWIGTVTAVTGAVTTTITWTGNSANKFQAIEEYNANFTSITPDLSQTKAVTGGAGTATAIDSGTATGTTAQANELAIVIYASVNSTLGNTMTYGSLTSGYSVAQQKSAVDLNLGSAGFGIALADQIFTSTKTNPDCTGTVTGGYDTYNSMIVTFKVPGASRIPDLMPFFMGG